MISHPITTTARAPSSTSSEIYWCPVNFSPPLPEKPPLLCPFPGLGDADAANVIVVSTSSVLVRVTVTMQSEHTSEGSAGDAVVRVAKEPLATIVAVPETATAVREVIEVPLRGNETTELLPEIGKIAREDKVVDELPLTETTAPLAGIGTTVAVLAATTCVRDEDVEEAFETETDVALLTAEVETAFTLAEEVETAVDFVEATVVDAGAELEVVLIAFTTPDETDAQSTAGV